MTFNEFTTWIVIKPWDPICEKFLRNMNRVTSKDYYPYSIVNEPLIKFAAASIKHHNFFPVQKVFLALTNAHSAQEMLYPVLQADSTH